MPRKPSLATSLLRLLDASPAPAYALDADRRLVWGNAALAAWLGIPLDDLVGLRCDYHASGEVGGLSAIVAGLCPPPALFAGQPPDAGPHTIAAPVRNGQCSQRRARFLPVPLEPASPGAERCGVLALVEPADLPAGAEPVPAQEPIPAALHARLQQLRAQWAGAGQAPLIGQSPALRRIREQARLAAAGKPRTLIVGPPGSGQEQAARAIHYQGRSGEAGPLVPIACPLVDAEMLRGTLAHLPRRLPAGAADKPPTLLLSEVDRLAPAAQEELAALLLAPGGGPATIATARQPLIRRAERGKFLPELAQALSTLVIALPPLARRPEDLPLLAQHVLEEFNTTGGKQLAGLAPEALELLAAYAWPGNLEQLTAAVRHACERAAGPLVAAADLPGFLQLAHGAVAHPRRAPQKIVLDEFLAGVERELLQRALAQARGNKTKAADLLGLNRARLLRRLEQLGLAAAKAEEEPVVFEPLTEGMEDG